VTSRRGRRTVSTQRPLDHDPEAVERRRVLAEIEELFERNPFLGQDGPA
jgi:hypothetical protein